MENTGLLDENWQVLLSLFPENWKELAKLTGAMSRKFRSFSSEEALMRTLLLHVAQGYSYIPKNLGTRILQRPKTSF